MLVFFSFRYEDLPGVALVVGGAIAAVLGQSLLALAFRAFGSRLPRERQESLEILGQALGESRGGVAASFAFFVLAPLPSAQMFEAAGLARIRLLPLLVAFLAGRLVSYAIYVSAASAAHDSLSDLLREGLLSPHVIVTQLLAVGLLVAMVKIDWPTVIDRARACWAGRRGRPAPPPIRDTLQPDASTADAKRDATA